MLACFWLTKKEEKKNIHIAHARTQTHTETHSKQVILTLHWSDDKLRLSKSIESMRITEMALKTASGWQCSNIQRHNSLSKHSCSMAFVQNTKVTLSLHILHIVIDSVEYLHPNKFKKRHMCFSLCFPFHQSEWMFSRVFFNSFRAKRFYDFASRKKD